jgi:autotransporter-associated beta strand protein
MAAGTGFIHERNTSEAYSNNWSLTGTGQVILDSRYARPVTLSGIISGSAGMTFNDSAVLSGANTYTGATIVSTGTVALTGNRSATAGAITVGNVNGSTATLNISNGNCSVGTVAVGSGDSTAGGILNQTGGSLTLTGNTQLIIGNGAGTTTGTAAAGTYNLSGGTLTGGVAANRGIILGTNNGTTGTFNLSGTGNLALGSAILMVGRSDAALTGSSGYFNQTGGTAVIGNVTVAGGSGTGTTGHLNLAGGTFSATNFASLASAASSTATITLGGSALATLPAFPTARGAGSTATLHFDGGTLIPAAASTSYLGGLTTALIKSGGAKFDVASGRDITVSQKLLADPVSTGGGLSKSGAGKLTLSGANTYTGNTTVSAGTLELAPGGSLRFVPAANGISNKIAGSAAVLLKGAFVIDLGGAAATNGSSWTLVDVGTLAETYDPSFSVSGFTESSNVWEKSVGATVWTFTEATGVLTCSVPVGFALWLSGHSIGPDNQPGDDPDHDGMDHLLEYVLNGNPLVSDPAVLPDLVVTDEAFEFSYSRLDLSLADTIQAFEFGNALTGWQTVVIPADVGVSTVGIATITITDTGSTDSVKVSIPKAAGGGGGLFGRLQVTR